MVQSENEKKQRKFVGGIKSYIQVRRVQGIKLHEWDMRKINGRILVEDV